MKADGSRLLTVATSIADGERVDWGQLEAHTGSDQERALLRSLRVIAAIGELHRASEASQRPAPDAPASPADAVPTDTVPAPAEPGRIVGRIRPPSSK